MIKTRSYILQGQALFRGVKQLLTSSEYFAFHQKKRDKRQTERQTKKDKKKKEKRKKKKKIHGKKEIKTAYKKKKKIDRQEKNREIKDGHLREIIVG